MFAKIYNSVQLEKVVVDGNMSPFLCPCLFWCFCTIISRQDDEQVKLWNSPVLLSTWAVVMMVGMVMDCGCIEWWCIIPLECWRWCWCCCCWLAVCCNVVVGPWEWKTVPAGTTEKKFVGRTVAIGWNWGIPPIPWRVCIVEEVPWGCIPLWWWSYIPDKSREVLPETVWSTKHAMSISS